MPGPVFISHATADKAFVEAPRKTLEGQGIPVWQDNRNLRGGSKLAPEIKQAIDEARQVIVFDEELLGYYRRYRPWWRDRGPTPVARSPGRATTRC